MADEELNRLLTVLPRDIGAKLAAIPVLFEKIPSPELIRDGLEPDLLGLFVGNDCVREGLDPMPPEILLFLGNIWDEAEGNEERYREEVRKTLLHEIGHYLGLSEDELWERDLD